MPTPLVRLPPGTELAFRDHALLHVILEAADNTLSKDVCCSIHERDSRVIVADRYAPIFAMPHSHA